MFVPVVDGDDMTEYDNDEYLNINNVKHDMEDNNTLDQLEWELASMAGRITGKYLGPDWDTKYEKGL
jgi:hypothetical protein